MMYILHWSKLFEVLYSLFLCLSLYVSVCLCLSTKKNVLQSFCRCYSLLTKFVNDTFKNKSNQIKSETLSFVSIFQSPFPCLGWFLWLVVGVSDWWLQFWTSTCKFVFRCIFASWIQQKGLSNMNAYIYLYTVKLGYFIKKF